MSSLIGILFIIICILLILIVLLQKGRGGGLGSAFGGGAGSAFGTRTGDVLTWITIVLTGIFIVAAIGLGPMIRPDLGTVVTPRFDPPEWPEGEERDDIQVGMEVDTRGASIHYAIDDIPTRESPVYKGTKVTIRKGHTLRAIAYRPGLKDSEMREMKYEPEKPESRPATRPTTRKSLR
jgi:preprotein translocase subunit SecG